MPDNDLLRRSLDAGVAFTQLTRKRAETIVRDLVKNGEVSREQATARVEELLERSRQNTDAILAIVRKEIDERMATLNLVTREELTNLATRLGLPGNQSKAETASDLRAPTTPSAPSAPAPSASSASSAPSAPSGPAAKAPTATTFATKKSAGATKVAPTTTPARPVSKAARPSPAAVRPASRVARPSTPVPTTPSSAGRVNAGAVKKTTKPVKKA